MCYNQCVSSELPTVSLGSLVNPHDLELWIREIQTPEYRGNLNSLLATALLDAENRIHVAIQLGLPPEAVKYTDFTGSAINAAHQLIGELKKRGRLPELESSIGSIQIPTSIADIYRE